MEPADFEHYESIYWVFTQLCNDTCAHCYNNSGPKGERISPEDCLAIVGNLPAQLDRLILSGGEPLTERPKLFAILDALRNKYQGKTQIMLQTNGDLLTGEILDDLIAHGVTRIDIASMDRYHKKAGARRAELEGLFGSRGMSSDNTKPLIEKETYIMTGGASYGFWGANEEMWLGGNWARGRAMQNKIWLHDPEHNFCAILSGGKGFLGGTDLPQELSIQLWKINPCCPGTRFPMGDARTERVVDVLARMSKSEIMRQINQGVPYQMGESIGVNESYARERGRVDGNICLWCDEFFEKHYDMENLQPRPAVSPA
ncbi:MAG: radical SAM protein [Chthoniobacterales bacterium]|nr:radical SAM protein [Chthoniobacterales bacterium]